MKKRVFTRIMTLARPYTGRLVMSLLCALLFAASSGATLAMILPIFDDILGADPSRVPGMNLENAMSVTVMPHLERAWGQLSGFRLSAAGEELARAPGAFMDGIHLSSPKEALLAVILTVVGLILLKNLACFGQTFFVASVEEGMLSDLRTEVYRHLLNLDLSFFHRSRTGELTSRLTADVVRIKSTVTQSMITASRQVLLLAVYLTLAFWVSWRLTLVTLAVLPPSMALIIILGKSLRRKSHRAQERMADFASVLNETITGIRVVKAFAMESFELSRFHRSVDSHRQREISLRRMQAILGPITEFLGAVAAGVILWYGGNAVIGGDGMSAGKFMVFLAAALSMMDPAKGLSKAYAAIMAGLAAGERVFLILDTEPGIREIKSPVVPRTLEHSIVFDSVTFGYDPARPVLTEVSLKIGKGEIVALVGPSGGGKSTLADMIPRFFDPDRGRILLDGTDLRDLSIAGLRNLLGVVTQETVLFNDSVFNNIAYGASGISMEQVIRAAEVANAVEFIDEMPEGFETVIGERGVTLSGGQRQRLAIARAVLKNPPLLIFDEATSALDTRSEMLVQTAIDKLVQGRTSLVIAHRLSTIKKATRVIYVENGKILEQGTHDTLMQLGARYRMLWEMQFSNG